MSVLLLKLILTPTLIALTTLAVRRWGPAVGGWIVGLPLTSGPVSVFLTVEQGPDFAAAAAAATLLGSLSVAAFCLTYAMMSRKHPWQIAILASLCAFFLCVFAFARVTPPLLPTFIATNALIGLTLVVMKPLHTLPPAAPAYWWDIPLRMAAATGMVILVTTLSQQLGPRLSGLFSTFPVFICVMSVFSHKLCGPDSAYLLARGVVVGTFAFIAFFLTVALTVQRWNMLVVYLLALGAAMAVNLGIMLFLARRKHAVAHHK